MVWLQRLALLAQLLVAPSGPQPCVPRARVRMRTEAHPLSRACRPRATASTRKAREGSAPGCSPPPPHERPAAPRAGGAVPLPNVRRNEIGQPTQHHHPRWAAVKSSRGNVVQQVRRGRGGAGPAAAQGAGAAAPVGAPGHVTPAAARLCRAAGGAATYGGGGGARNSVPSQRPRARACEPALCLRLGRTGRPQHRVAGGAGASAVTARRAVAAVHGALPCRRQEESRAGAPAPRPRPEAAVHAVAAACQAGGCRCA